MVHGSLLIFVRVFGQDSWERDYSDRLCAMVFEVLHPINSSFRTGVRQTDRLSSSLLYVLQPVVF